MHALERSDIAPMRAAMKLFRFVTAEVDTNLRYVWIDSPHPDFDPVAIIGNRDDELTSPAEAKELMELKRDVLCQAEPIKRVLGFQRSDGWRYYCICAFPLRNSSGAIDGVFTLGFDIPEGLRGILPICAHCKKIRDDHGVWQIVEAYVQSHTQAQFSHSICPDCMEKHYGKTKIPIQMDDTAPNKRSWRRLTARLAAYCRTFKRRRIHAFE